MADAKRVIYDKQTLRLFRVSENMAKTLLDKQDDAEFKVGDLFLTTVTDYLFVEGPGSTVDLRIVPAVIIYRPAPSPDLSDVMALSSASAVDGTFRVRAGISHWSEYYAEASFDIWASMLDMYKKFLAVAEANLRSGRPARTVIRKIDIIPLQLIVCKTRLYDGLRTLRRANLQYSGLQPNVVAEEMYSFEHRLDQRMSEIMKTFPVPDEDSLPGAVLYIGGLIPDSVLIRQFRSAPHRS